VIRGVIFDLGGTLAVHVPPLSAEDLDRRNTAALLAWLRQQTWQVDDTFVDALVAERQAGFARRSGGTQEVTAAEVLRPLLRRFGLPDDAAFTRAAEAAFFEPELASMRPLPEATSLLTWIRDQKIRAGLASNASSHYFVVECCHRLGFAAWLDPIASSADLGWTKPAPRIFEFILSRWSLPPDEVAMVGDTPAADIAGASWLGLRSILLAEGDDGTAGEAGPRPDKIAPDLGTVRRILAQWITAPR
jgi:FMN phosphatase YigB (HAD superfamily)